MTQATHKLATNKPAIWFWIISVLALIWNALGVMAYIMQVSMSDEVIAKLPPADQAALAATPAWATAAFAIAVFAATLGCVALLLRKSWAFGLFALSFIAILAQQLYFFVLSDVGKSLGGGELMMTLSIPVIGALLIWFSRSMASKGWLS